MTNSYSSQSREKFAKILAQSNHLVVLTGAGISAESGIPTFRGEGGFWRQYNAMELATPAAFRNDPALVWQFYQYRRNVVLEKHPNKGHLALVKCEEDFLKKNKKFTLITQNVDGLHLKAGTKNIIQMHGNILETRCTVCKKVEHNLDILVDANSTETIAFENLPKCKECGGLLRPNVVWFHESIDLKDMERIDNELESCDLFMIIGTSGVVYPAAGFGEIVAERNVPIAEFNIEDEPGCSKATYYFKGKSGETLPEIFDCN